MQSNHPIYTDAGKRKFEGGEFTVNPERWVNGMIKEFLLLVAMLLSSPAYVHAQVAEPMSEQEAAISLKVDRGGKAREYNLAIFPDGRVVFEGVRYVARLGRQEVRIEESKVQQLIQTFLDAGFTEMNGPYVHPGMRDSPIAAMTLNARGIYKSVEFDAIANAGDGAKLTKLALEFARQTGAYAWIYDLKKQRE